LLNSIQLTMYRASIPNKLQVLTKYFKCLNLTQPKPNLIKTLTFVHTFLISLLVPSYRFECVYKNSSVINSFYSGQEVFSSYAFEYGLSNFLTASCWCPYHGRIYYTILVLNIVFCHSA
jgi:hypothetical protein